MSRSWPRVASPSPAFSTLITSAPNQASSWVQVGPDWTCVKSRILTPSSALPSWPHGFFDILGGAFGAAFATTLGALPFTGLATTEEALPFAATFAFALPLAGAFFAIFFAIVVVPYFF